MDAVHHVPTPVHDDFIGTRYTTSPVYDDFVGTRYTTSLLRIVNTPLGDILFNVCGDAIQFLLIANNAVMESGLPDERNFVGAGVMGDGTFQPSNNDG